MNKTVLIILGVLLPMFCYAQGEKEIKIRYQHSKRIPYNLIEMKLYFTDNEYILDLKASQMKGQTGHEYSNIEKSFVIEEAFFNNIYSKMLNINYNQIIKNSESIVGSDGCNVYISVGTHQNNISLNVWSPEYEQEKRSTVDLNIILEEIFSFVDLKEYL